MPNPKPNQEGLEPGLNTHLMKARDLEPLAANEESKPIRVRGSKALFEKLNGLKPKEIGEALERGLEP